MEDLHVCTSHVNKLFCFKKMLIRQFTTSHVQQTFQTNFFFYKKKSDDPRGTTIKNYSTSEVISTTYSHVVKL